MRGAVVDGPHVELAAGLADGLAPAAVRRAASGTISASQRPARHVDLDRRRQLRAHVGGARVGRELGQPHLRRVLAQARDRPAEPQLRLELAQHDQRAHPVRGDQRALDQAVLAQRVDDALLVAGELEVDVELDAVERARREVREALLERRRVRRRARSRGRAAGGPRPARAGARAGRRTRSCRRRGRAPRRRRRACCRGRSGPRPCGRSAASALTSWTPVCRPIVVALPACADVRGVAAARARPAGACRRRP